MARLFYGIDELLTWPLLPGIEDKSQIYYHVRPARPANLVVTRDPQSGDLNVSAGTYGVLTEYPLTIGLHISKHSFDTARNIQGVGTECVVALPTRNQVRETWYTALPIPRGISEGDVAGFTMLPSRSVSVPGVAECPVNLECRVELIKDWRTHWAVFLRVVGASIDTELQGGDRRDLIRLYPTHEVDDQINRFGGSIERLGVNGDLLDCPAFPAFGDSTEQWIADLGAAGRLSGAAVGSIRSWLLAWREAETVGKTAELARLRAPLTKALELAAWEEWAALEQHVAAVHAGGQA